MKKKKRIRLVEKPRTIEIEVETDKEKFISHIQENFRYILFFYVDQLGRRKCKFLKTEKIVKLVDEEGGIRIFASNDKDYLAEYNFYTSPNFMSSKNFCDVENGLPMVEGYEWGTPPVRRNRPKVQQHHSKKNKEKKEKAWKKN